MSFRAAGENPFPHKFHVSISLGEYIEKYSSLKNEEILENVTESIAGNDMNCLLKIVYEIGRAHV